MGNYITFQIPNTETSWNYAIIERSLQQSASYSELTSQVITNNTFYDETGLSTHWYRLRFFDSGTTVYSAYTDPFQSDKEYYCTPKEVTSFMGFADYTDSTNPTRFEVEDLIADVCDQIDEEIHTAFRKTRVTNEYHDVKIKDRFIGYTSYPYDFSTRIALYLKNRNIRPFVSGTHKIEVWDGDSWVDFVATYTEGRDQDYWINYERGIIYFVNRYPLWQRSNVRVTYDYGTTLVPGDIRRAAILITAAYLLGGKQDLSVIYPQSSLNFPGHGERWQIWLEQAQKLLAKKSNVLSPRYY